MTGAGAAKALFGNAFYDFDDLCLKLWDEDVISLLTGARSRRALFGDDSPDSDDLLPDLPDSTVDGFLNNSTGNSVLRSRLDHYSSFLPNHIRDLLLCLGEGLPQPGPFRRAFAPTVPVRAQWAPTAAIKAAHLASVRHCWRCCCARDGHDVSSENHSQNDAEVHLGVQQKLCADAQKGREKKRLRVYVQNASVCTGKTCAC